MANPAKNTPTVPLEMVGGCSFGIYPKISNTSTYNMYISDDFLVSFPGYKAVAILQDTGKGRAIFGSTRWGKMIAVVDQGVFSIDKQLGVAKISNIDTVTGDVYIAENNRNQIAICDKKNLYIYDWSTNDFTQLILDWTPVHVSFQDGYFIAAVANQPQWRLSDFNNGLIWPNGSSSTGAFQTKADNVLACIRIPSKENQLFVMGNDVTLLWADLPGRQLFPYVKSSAFNIDYGTVNPASIGIGDKFIVWAGGSEKSSIAIMYSEGGGIEQISTDGINYKLEQLVNPSNCYGFTIKKNGHVFFILTFADPADNFTLLIDLTTKKIFYLCDENMNFYIAKRMTYFNNTHYFVSFNDGKLYELNNKYTTYDGKTIPRVRVCPPIRKPDSTPFVANNLNFIIEQGHNKEVARVDMSMSNDGGENFGNIVGLQLNSLGNRRNRVAKWDLGYSNDAVFQFRFWSNDRIVVGNGEVGLFQ